MGSTIPRQVALSLLRKLGKHAPGNEPQQVCVGQNTTCRDQFSASTIWVLGIELMSQRLTTVAFSYGTSQRRERRKARKTGLQILVYHDSHTQVSRLQSPVKLVALLTVCLNSYCGQTSVPVLNICC